MENVLWIINEKMEICIIINVYTKINTNFEIII